nr:GH25780p [Drosophila melanogaster]
MEATDQEVMLEGREDLMSTSATSSTNGGDTNGCGKKLSVTSPDPTPYVTKQRVTRPTPPAPSKNPMQFVQIKPCNLYQTAQEQLKKAEEVKKLKEVKKEEPEEWQNNLDNWKSSRRKRVEHIIDRAVETKKLELEEHDRLRRKSKTFTEMMEERAERGGPRGRAKLASLAVYNEDETNDLSDLGIGTSSASGKSSLSGDYDNNSVMSDHAAELDKAIGAASSVAAGVTAQNVDEQLNHINRNGSNGNHGNGAAVGQTGPSNSSKSAGRQYISSPGYDTSSSNAQASSPDLCEYTYEGAIQDYKQRVQRASSNGNGNANGKLIGEHIAYPTRRGSKIEDRLSGFEVTSPSDTQEGVEKQKVDVPKVDISKRKEIFEQAKAEVSNGGAPAAPKLVFRDGLTNGNSATTAPKSEVRRLSGDISSIRDRMQSLEQQRKAFSSSKSVDVPVPPLKQRLNSLQQSVAKEEQKKPPLVALIDARQLEIMRGEEERMRQQQQKEKHSPSQTTLCAPKPAPPALIIEEPPVADTNDDSGIQEDTADELQQQQQLNAAIAALALEERQLEEAANAVNQIEAEFDELTDLHPSPLPPSPALPAVQQSLQQPTVAQVPAQAVNQAAAPPLRDMEFSVSCTNNFIEPAKISPCDVNVVAASAVSVSKSGPTPNPTSTPNMVSSSPNCNLRREPSNEMVHHRNLLKMFKETFQNDDDLKEVCEIVTSPGQFTQIIDFSKRPSNPPIPIPTLLPTSTPIPTQIPRPLGKPPMSPKAVRLASSPKGHINPLSSPTNSGFSPPQFSINGRVEIFNSRQLDKPPTPPAPPKKTVRSEHPLKEAVPSPEVVMCAPPMTIVDPDELPKPNTVKALSNCFSQSDSKSLTSPIMSPKPLPSGRIPQITPPASPKPPKRVQLDEVDRSSGDYAPVVGQTKAIVHTPPSKINARANQTLDPLAPNDSLCLHTSSPSEIPSLKACSPNESSLFKLASSRPTSPSVDVASCQKFLNREAPKDIQLAEEDRKRMDQFAVEEMPCDKIDVTKSPQPNTGFQIVTEDLVKKCDGKNISEAVRDLDVPPSQEDIALCAGLLDCLAPAQEPICDSIDVRNGPVPATGFQDISEEEVKKCEKHNKNYVITNRPSSPIGSVRAAHSKALMDTCEQIIAEERKASSQMMKTSLPESVEKPSTPLPGRKSKIPIPKPCCISASGTDSISRAGYVPTAPSHLSGSAQQPLIARTHVVETEIKVKEISPPSIPKTPEQTQLHASPTKEKKAKNIFDFLRRNFGHQEEPQHHSTLNETLEKKVVLTSTKSGVDVVNADEFVRVDNSKFYLASELEDVPVPPPLPKTPAPVNIEIRKKITTNEILEENTTEQALTQEISDLLDDEIMKLEN